MRARIAITPRILGLIMPNSLPKARRYRFGAFELDTEEGTVSRNGKRLKLQDLPYRLLLMLLERPGEVISREEVRQRLWPENTFVEFDNSLGVAVRKVRDALGDDAEAPRYVETVPRRGYRFLAPVTVMEAAPVANPPESVLLPDTSVAPRVSVERAGPLPDPPIWSGRWWRYLLLAALVLVAIGVALHEIGALSKVEQKKSAAPAALDALKGDPLRVRRSVAVIGFRNLPGHAEDNWLSPAFAEMLNTELAADGALRTISGEDVARAKRELPLADEDSLAKGTLERLRTDPGADVVVLGSYTPLSGKGEKRIRLDVRLQDTARGETIAEQAFVGTEDDLFELVGRAGAALRKSLGATAVSTEAYAQVRAALPKSSLAVKLYTEGQARLWAFDYIHARDLLIQAIAVEPSFPLAHAALSDSWSHLGYALKARDEIEHARSLSEHLGPEERLVIEGQYDKTMRDRNNAIAVYKTLFTQFPDNLDYGLRLADEQRWVNPEEALQTVVSLRRLSPPVGDDPRIDLIEARVWMGRDFSKVRSAAQRAIQKGTAQGSREIVAGGHGILCQTLGNGASTDEAIQDCESARQNAAAVGDRNAEARILNDFAGLYYQLGDLNRAETMFRKAILVFREVGDIEGVTAATSNLGDVSLARGNLTDAARALSDTIPGYRELDDKDGVALTLNDLAEVSRLRGDLDAAVKIYQQAKATAQEINDKRALAYVLNGMGEVLVDRGDLDGARTSYQASLTLRKQIGEKQTAAETELALARLSVEEHRAADAETVIRKCKEQFHQDQQADDELSASVALIDALLAQTKYPEAAKDVDAAKPAVAKSVNELIRLQFGLVSARVELASGQIESARTDFEDILHRAHQHQFMGLELETRLAMVDLKRSGQRGAAKTELLAIEKAARGKGFGLIAGKAAAHSL